MTTKKKHPLVTWLPLIILAAAMVAAFVRVQVHAEDPKVHVDGENYVPRLELDYRLDAAAKERATQMEVLQEIHEDVREIRKDQSSD